MEKLFCQRRGSGKVLLLDLKIHRGYTVIEVVQGADEAMGGGVA